MTMRQQNSGTLQGEVLVLYLYIHCILDFPAAD